MSHKIPLIIQTACLVSCVAVGLLAYLQSADALREEANNKLLAMLEFRQTAISGYLETIRQDLQFQAANPTVHQGLRAFTAAWRELGENQTQTLQSLYIHDNPYPIGDKEKFDAAGDGSSYSRAHAMYHPFFRGFLKQRGYYDAFLFDSDGNLIYTVFKERDYATNLNRDEWRDTDLGKVFRAARENATASYQAFFDFVPYAPSNGTPAGFIATPVLDEAGRILGVLAFRMPIDRLNAVMQVSAGLGETGETYIVGVDFLMRSDSRFSDDSTILARRIDTTPVKAALDGATGVMEAGDYRGMDLFAGHAPLDFLGTRWAVIAEMDSDEVMAPVDALGIGVLISSALVALIVAIFGQVAARKIVRPLTAMRALADGDKTVEVPSRGRSDEIGDMADAVEVFRQKAIKIEQMAVEQEAKDRETAAQKRQMMLDLTAQFEGGVKGIVETVSSASTEMQSTAQSMAATAAEAGRQTSAVAAASEEATTNVQTVAAAAEELSKSVEEISRRVVESTAIAHKAVAEADRTNDTVRGLAEAAQKIGEVVDLISDIAEQTNLLALNATIEAARAGDAGKGFAVVASEVKSLANQTAKATEEIAAQITSMQSVTRDAVAAIELIGTTISEISEIATAIAAAVEEQGAATYEIARNVQQAAAGTQDVSGNITGVNQAAGETGQAANQVLEAAHELSQQSDTLRGQVEKFLADIRAA